MQNDHLNLEDLIGPSIETSSSFKFAHWFGRRTEEVQVDSCGLPQEARMVQEFVSLIQGIISSEGQPDMKWEKLTRMTQSVIDAVMRSIIHGTALKFWGMSWVAFSTRPRT